MSARGAGAVRGSRRRAAAEPPLPSAPARPAAPRDVPLALLVDVGLLIGLWLAFAATRTAGSTTLGYDSYRDIAYARAILAGHPFDDPMIAGFRAWYPPGIPALFALASAVTRVDVGVLYENSATAVGGALPVMLFLLVRQVWGRATAWLAVPFVLLGSRWWLVHALLPISSIQTVPIALGAVLAWHRWGRASRRGAVATGLLLAVTLWCHVLCGAMAIGAVALHEVLAALARPGAIGSGRGATWRRPGLLAVVLGAALGSPPLLAQILVRRVNDAPHHWFGPELHDPRFALQSQAPLAPVLGLVGLVLVARRREQEGWLLGWALVAAAGLALGYAGHDLGLPVPWVIPHEFQWHLQLALMIAAAVASVRLAARFTRGARAVAVAALLAVASLAPVLPHLRDAGANLMPRDEHLGPLQRMSEWIRRNLPARSVLIVSPEPGYLVSALSGTRCIVVPTGHLNPAANPGARMRDLVAMLDAPDDRTLARLASRYDARYLLLTADLAPMAVIRKRFDAWPGLELLHVADTTAALYRLRAASEARDP